MPLLSKLSNKKLISSESSCKSLSLKIKQYEDSIQNLNSENTQIRQNFESEREKLIALISKQKGQLKKLEDLQSYIKGPSSSMVKDFTDKIESYKHKIFELNDKIYNQEAELERLRHYYNKNTFFDPKKVVDRSKSREKRQSAHPVLQARPPSSNKPVMVRNYNVKNDEEFVAMKIQSYN